MHAARPATAMAVAFLLLPFTATAAFAAAPPNDTAAGATPVSLGQTYTQDTTEATTDALDASLNAQCGAPFTNASVWFTYTDTTGAGFLADMTASDYSGGFMIAEGDPADGNLVACGPGQVATRGAAGTTYYVVAFSDTATNAATSRSPSPSCRPPRSPASRSTPRGTRTRTGPPRSPAPTPARTPTATTATSRER